MASLKRAIRRKCALAGICDDATLVYGDGPSRAHLMVVGEAPGRDETREGRPFVGKAGRFFIGVLEDSMGMPRENIYITNVVKTWPKLPTKRGKTRKPSKDELAFFTPYLEKEVAIVAPRVILAVGKTAYHALIPTGVFKHGVWYEHRGTPVMAVYHPAYILRKGKSLKENTAGLKNALAMVKKALLAGR